MKKQLIAVLLFLCGMTLQAEDEYLYWMIDSDAKIEGLWGKETPLSGGTYYAKVGYTTTQKTVEEIVAAGKGLDSYLSLYALPGDDALKDNATYGGSNVRTGYGDNHGVPPIYAGLTAANYTYWVELWSAQDEAVVGYGSLGTYADLSAFISPMTGFGSMASPIAVSAFLVPEPNSALLLMIGCAALALRRRRKIAA
mgnify:CR=1 FL=1